MKLWKKARGQQRLRWSWITAIIMAVATSGQADHVDHVKAAASLDSLVFINTIGVEQRIEQYRGRVVLVDLWATWCPSCALLLPTYEQWAEQWRSRGLTVVAISQDTDIGLVKPYVREHDIRLPVWLDPAMQASAAVKTVKMPTAIVVNRDGTIRTVVSGGDKRSVSQLQAAIESALQSNRAPVASTSPTQ